MAVSRQFALINRSGMSIKASYSVLKCEHFYLKFSHRDPFRINKSCRKALIIDRFILSINAYFSRIAKSRKNAQD